MNKNKSNAVSPAPIMALTTAYWGSQTLFTANRLGLFALLGENEKDATAIAESLNVHVRQASLLLNACVALGLLEVANGLYCNSALSDAYLVPGKDAYMGNAIRYSDNLYEAWGRLEKSLKEGKPTMPAEDYLGKDAERTRHFVHGMHNRALGIGAMMVNMVDLSSRKQLLDIGGGPGTYAAMFCWKNPQLNACVLDLPPIVGLAQDILNTLPGGDRVTTLPGDYSKTDFPKGNDVVLISGVLHRESGNNCKAMISRAVDSLSAGGLLIVSDVFTDAGGTAPAFATLFGLNMMLSAEDGGVHSDGSVVQWMQEVGLYETEVQSFPPPMPHRLIVGTKLS